MRKSSLLLILASGALLASCGHHVLTPDEIASWDQAHSSSQPAVSSEEPSVEPTPSSEVISSEDITSEEPTSQEEPSSEELTSEGELTSEEISSEELTSEEELSDYVLYVGFEPHSMVDATAEIEEGDTAFEQWKVTGLDVVEGDVLSFTYLGDHIAPGANYESAGNNAHYDEATTTITVRATANDATLYLKVYAPEQGQLSNGYDVWLTGYTAPATSSGDSSIPETSGVGLYIRGTAVGGWDAVAANELQTSSDSNNQGQLLNITLAVGDFKIANADWSKSWGWSYKNQDESEDHLVVQGGAKANFEKGASDGNIHCKVAGTYNMYLTTNNYLYIETAA